MKNLFFLSFVLWTFSLPASAHSDDVEQFCKKMEIHTGNEANYVPGKDVHGNDVVPADITPPLHPIYDPIIIPVEVDLAERFNLSLPTGVELKPQVAWIEIYQDGRILYNGQNISKSAYAICDEEKKDVQGNQDGQDAPDPLRSGDNQDSSQEGQK